MGDAKYFILTVVSQVVKIGVTFFTQIPKLEWKLYWTDSNNLYLYISADTSSPVLAWLGIFAVLQHRIP